MAISSYTNKKLRNRRKVQDAIGYHTAGDNFHTGGSGSNSLYSNTLQSVARRYGKKKKRRFRLPDAPIRPGVLGTIGASEQSSEPPPP